MAKQTLVFESAVELSLHGEMILISDQRTGEKTLRLIEDIRLVLIDNRMVRITVPLLNKLSEQNVGVVFCDDRHMPVTMLMDLDSNSLQSRRFQCQLAAKVPTNRQLWKQIVEAKIRNQSLLLEQLGVGKSLLAVYYNHVQSGDTTNREGVAAKVYWNQLMGRDFIRDRFGAHPYGLLNYGYALLRAMVARSLMNAGLLPTVGILHCNRYDSFPLADDMMEPYRPFIDRRTGLPTGNLRILNSFNHFNLYLHERNHASCTCGYGRQCICPDAQHRTHRSRDWNAGRTGRDGRKPRRPDSPAVQPHAARGHHP